MKKDTSKKEKEIKFGDPAPAQRGATITCTVNIDHGNHAPAQEIKHKVEVHCLKSLSQCPASYKDSTARTMADNFYNAVRALMDN